MKKLIVENQEDFKIFKGTFTTQNGKDIPVFYLKGDTSKLNTAEGLYKKDNPYGAMWDYDKKMIRFWQDRKDPQITIDTKIKPLIKRINEFYKYSLEIDNLIQDIQEYVPSETKTEKENDDVIATSAEASAVEQNLLSFKDMLLNIETDADFKSKIAAIYDFKAAQGYEYTMNNILLIKAQRPNATIVNSKSDWETAYKRTVNDGAKPIFVKRPKKKGYNAAYAATVKNFLASVGKKSTKDLNPNEQMRLKKIALNANGRNANDFELVGHYDVSDTTQMEGTEDFIAKAQAASTKMNIDNDNSNIVSDEIKPIYNGLVAYADSQNIGINNPSTGERPNISVPQNGGNDARITKLLAKSILNQILHEGYLKKKGGFASKLHVGSTTAPAVAQQSEVASWMFMYAFGIDFKTTQVDVNAIFGDDKDSMQIVLDTVSKAVNHLVDFVNVNIKKGTNKLTEDGDANIQGKHVTPMDVARMLGVEKEFNDVKNNANLQELHERLIKKVLRLI